MGIFYMDAKIISRSSGRSAIGAVAYRASEKLRLVEMAAYRSGEELRDEDVKITHDYSRKGGVVYSEIMLPEGAPKEFENREIFWNFVEHREKRADSRLAREIVVALQAEFDLQEQIEVLREYVKENFVDKGLGVDFAVHDTGNGNSHAHIMFTSRYITSDGLGRKNRDLDKVSELMIWRESWARVNNCMFERKGLEGRIDYRSYKDQGVDREPQIHLRYEAWALEKKGIKTERGNYNREIARRNNERAVKTQEQKSDDPQEADAATNVVSKNKSPTLKKEGGAERAVLMLAKRGLREIEEHLKTEKALQIVGKLQEDREFRREAEKTARQMTDLKESYIDLDKELSTILCESEVCKQEVWQLDFLVDSMGEHVKNVGVMRSKVAGLQMERQKLTVWEGKRKKEKDVEIEQAIGNIRVAQYNFKKDYAIDFEQAPTEIKRVREKIRVIENELDTQITRIPTIRERQATIELEYRTQKLLNELRFDRGQIEQFLEKMNNPPDSVREKLRHNDITRRLNTITKETVRKIVEKLPESQAQLLAKLYEEREAELLKQVQKDRAITIERDPLTKN